MSKLIDFSLYLDKKINQFRNIKNLSKKIPIILDFTGDREEIWMLKNISMDLMASQNIERVDWKLRR